MLKKLHVTLIEKQNEGYMVKTEETLVSEQAKALKAGERMLVDSEGLAFIYILEDHSEFIYLTFPIETWSTLHQAHQERIKMAFLLRDESTIELTGIYQELDFLLENIDGNGNYGEAMEAAVKEIFS
ncbi:UPF0738 family protein [Bacillus solitudinis]|uniref:UPF0738 family protein n=1 Tax=Bacillus solitudinis TaxID=2014074 RepID=UPI000C2438D4|nr:hypothetical protein [Bacillus solitudinis]